ncbi:MAG TPA: phosphoribosyl-AMP cyclohydrolase [Stellaceae bacterium]|nr:phosphoribosyl-AMP cyclohydrolase [Stellaceae bacterium]
MLSQDATQAVLADLHFDGDGLIAAVAQQHDTGEVLMLAWMNREAVVETLATGRACYWSRSRKSLWRKGETSGQTQRLVEVRVDCDGDAVLLLVDQAGAACHTGTRSCFFRAVRGGELVTIAEPIVDPKTLYGCGG